MTESLPSADGSGPVSPRDRVVVLDALRGFALFGILLINLRLFSGWAFMPPDLRASGSAPIDETFRFIHDAFFFHKFYTLFSLLFGIGFAIQLLRSEARGEALDGRFAWRMVLLFGFGVVHLWLYEWDILHLYALLGLTLLVFRRLSGAGLLSVAALLLLVPVALRAWIVASGGSYDPQIAFTGWGMERMSEWGYAGRPSTWSVQTEGSWADLFRYGHSNWVVRTADVLERGFAFQILGTFLLGLWAGRRIMAGRVLDDARWLWTVVLIGLAVGLPANLLAADTIAGGVGRYVEERLELEALYAIGVTPLALAYAAAFALAWRSRAGRLVLGWMAPAGRMALTHYIGQSVLCILLFYQVGLDFAGEAWPADWTWIAAAIFAFQCAFSALWLSVFRYGPLEWVWRRLTYAPFT